MIGQFNLLESLYYMRSTGNFPQFVIFYGPDGWGKKTLMNEIKRWWAFNYVCEDVKVETLRNMLMFAYKTSDEYVYIIPDSHRMSMQAKNSILKLVEEPPRNATFLMSANNKDAILATVRSRAAVYPMQVYTKDELRKYCESLKDVKEVDFIVNSSECIADIQALTSLDIGKLKNHVITLLDKGNHIKSGNLIKSKKLMCVKKDDSGYSLELFFNCMQAECVRRIMCGEYDNHRMYGDIASVITSYKNDLSIRAINRAMLYTNFLIDLQEIEDTYGN